MAGVKGRSGAISDNLQAHCATMLREVAVQRMDTYLRSEAKGPKDPAWRWVVETYAQWAGIESHHAVEVSGALDLRAEAETFQGRIHRLIARLGSAAMPEGID